MKPLLYRCDDFRKQCRFCVTDNGFLNWIPCPDHLGEYVSLKKELLRSRAISFKKAGIPTLAVVK